MIQKLGNIGNVRESCMKPLEGFVRAHSDEFKVIGVHVAHMGQTWAQALMCTAYVEDERACWDTPLPRTVECASFQLSPDLSE